MNNALLGAFNINDEIAKYRPGDNEAGRRAETLIKSDGLRVVLVTMLSGITLHEHSAPGPITIHVLRGRFAMTFEREERELGPGELVSLASGVRHAVHTVEDGAFLLTIGWSPSDGKD